ncbi:hypothetical protein Tco_1024181, partial [Tanacetum coccineum]
VFLQYQMDECHKLLSNKVDLHNPEGHQIPRNVYEPLPLGGPPGQVTIQPQFFFNKDLDYLLTVPSLWVEIEREYDISAVYGITYWWFRRKELYINKHSESSDREAVRSQMRILSVISVKRHNTLSIDFLTPRYGDIETGGSLLQPLILKPKCTLSLEPRDRQFNLNIRVKRYFFTLKDGNLLEPNIKQALGGELAILQNQTGSTGKNTMVSKLPANSDVKYFFTSAQDGDPSQDDVRLCLGDDLKKAQDHSQRQAGDLP